MPLFDPADTMAQISRAHYGSNTNVNNTWVKHAGESGDGSVASSVLQA